MKLVNSVHEVLGVVTALNRGISNGESRANPVLVKAKKFDLPVYSYDAANPSKILSEMRRLKADLGIIATFGGEFSEPLCRAFSAGCVGIHPSLLPKYRGPAPISWAILNGEKKTGVTVYRITDEPYAGPILVQRETMIQPGEIWTELHFRLARIACDAIDAALKTLEQDSHYAGLQQDESLATRAPKLKEGDVESDSKRYQDDV